MSRSLLAEYETLHARGRYGATGSWSMPYIFPYIRQARPQSLLDYGCGQSDLRFLLQRKLGILAVTGFDPAISQLSRPSEDIFDLVVSVDVLEHIPDAEIDSIVKEMAALARDVLIVIDTRPAKARLSDGRNAHVSQHGEAWWDERLRRTVPVLRPFPIGRGRVAFTTIEPEPSALSKLFWFVALWTERGARRLPRRLWDRFRGIR